MIENIRDFCLQLAEALYFSCFPFWEQVINWIYLNFTFQSVIKYKEFFKKDNSFTLSFLLFLSNVHFYLSPVSFTIWYYKSKMLKKDEKWHIYFNILWEYLISNSFNSLRESHFLLRSFGLILGWVVWILFF